MPVTGKKVLVCTAHPDDETLCSGAIMKLVAGGNRVSLLVATSGNRGTHDMSVKPEEVAAARKGEMEAAAALLGIEKLIWLGIDDGSLYETQDLKKRVFGVMREEDPDIVLTFDPWTRYEFHSDHRTIGLLATEAAYLARCVWYFPEHAEAGKRATKGPEVYLFAPSEPNYHVDVTDYVARKVEAGVVHESQLRDTGMGFMMRMKELLDSLQSGGFDVKTGMRELLQLGGLARESFHKVYDSELFI